MNKIDAAAKALFTKAADIRDGDGDGMINDGTPQERPASKEITDSPQFRQWFKNSKVIDNDGTPLVVYHGTTSEFSEFTKTSDIGFHFGSKDQAKFLLESRGQETTGVVKGFYLSIQNPLRMPDGAWATEHDLAEWASENGFDDDGRIAETIVKFERDKEVMEKRNATSAEIVKRNSQWRKTIYTLAVQQIKKKGFDGVVYANEVEGDGISFIAFDSNQIKSVSNNGDFSPRNADVYKKY